jgi:hypothetical protein
LAASKNYQASIPSPTLIIVTQGSIPSLQQVTTAGNTTTDGITVQTLAVTSDILAQTLTMSGGIRAQTLNTIGGINAQTLTTLDNIISPRYDVSRTSTSGSPAAPVAPVATQNSVRINFIPGTFRYIGYIVPPPLNPTNTVNVIFTMGIENPDNYVFDTSVIYGSTFIVIPNITISWTAMTGGVIGLRIYVVTIKTAGPAPSPGDYIKVIIRLSA